MITKPRSSRRSPVWISGKMSLATFMGLAIVVLLLALGLAGYAWYSTRSENARLIIHTRRLEAQKQEEENARQARALEEQRAQDAARLTFAQNQQEAFAGSVRKVTDTLESLLVEVPKFQAQLELLRTGEPGRKVALYPELVASARVLFDRDAPAVPSRDEVASHLEALRRMGLQLADHAGTTFVPSAEMTDTLSNGQTWTATASTHLETAKRVVETLLREAQVKVPPVSNDDPPPSLQAAIDSVKEAERRAYLVKEAEVIGAAQLAATNKMLTVRSNEIALAAELARQKAEDEAKALQAEQDRESARVAAELEKKRLIEKAQRADIQNALASFLTPGNLQPKDKFTVEKQPISYSGLQAAGALQPDLPGILALQHIAVNPRDKIRPRMHKGRPKFEPEVFTLYKHTQDLLIELGPTLVDLGLLSP
jgi:hypothetical protein